MALAPPLRKKFRGDPPQQGDPLPIPIASYAGFPSSSASWNYFRGVYKDGVVIVNDLNHVASLWHNGYFGQLRNTELHSDEFVSEESYRYAKTWKLVETNGLKNMTFKKPVELDDDDDDGGEEETSGNIEILDFEPDDGSKKRTSCLKPVELDGDNQEISEKTENLDSDPGDESKGSSVGFKARAKAMDSVEICKDQVICEEVSTKDKEQGVINSDKKDGGAVENDAISPTQASEKCQQDAEENCKTVLTFQSDLIPSIFFDDVNVDTSRGDLELLPEEAMFLCYALGCLVIEKEWEWSKGQQFKGEQKSFSKELTIDQLWGEFVSDDPKFVARYAVYHHYRAKGWVVRSGLKFGADYILYKDGPPFYHAQFTVMIQCIWSDTSERDDSLSSREMSWTSFSGVQRLSNHVKKTPLISYVLRPRSLTAQDLYKVSCLKSLTVKEVVLARWDPTGAVEPENMITLD